MSNDGAKGYTVNSMHHALKGGTLGLKEMPGLIKDAIREKVWEGWVDIHTQQRYSQPDFETFITTPILEGLGATIDQIMALCEKDIEAQQLIQSELKRGPGAPLGNTNNRYSSKEEDTTFNNVKDCKAKAPVGNTRAAGLRRLEKDRPDLLADVIAGNKAVNSAMIEAGFRKKTVTVPVDVDGFFVAINKHFTTDQINQLISRLQMSNLKDFA